jgi:hypothetical protein
MGVEGPYCKNTHSQAVRVWTQYASVVLPKEFDQKNWEKEDGSFSDGKEEEETESIINAYHGQRETIDWGCYVRIWVVVLSPRTNRMFAKFWRGYGKNGYIGGVLEILVFNVFFCVGMRLTMKKKHIERKGTRKVQRRFGAGMKKKRNFILMFFVVLWFGAKGFPGEGPTTPGKQDSMEGAEKEVLREKKAEEEDAAMGKEGCSDDEKRAAIQSKFMWGAEKEEEATEGDEKRAAIQSKFMWGSDKEEEATKGKSGIFISYNRYTYIDVFAL